MMMVATVTVVMMVMGAVIVVMMVAMPMIVSAAIRFVLGIVTLLITPARHGLFEILRAVRVVMVFAKGPVIQQRISGQQSRLRAIGILHRC